MVHAPLMAEISLKEFFPRDVRKIELLKNSLYRGLERTTLTYRLEVAVGLLKIDDASVMSSSLSFKKKQVDNDL